MGDQSSFFSSLEEVCPLSPRSGGIPTLIPTVAELPFQPPLWKRVESDLTFDFEDVLKHTMEKLFFTLLGQLCFPEGCF